MHVRDFYKIQNLTTKFLYTSQQGKMYDKFISKRSLCAKKGFIFAIRKNLEVPINVHETIEINNWFVFAKQLKNILASMVCEF